MHKNKWVAFALFIILSLSSCGIFHKGCNCPKFGGAKSIVKIKNASV